MGLQTTWGPWGTQKECQPCVRDHLVSPSMTRAPILPPLSLSIWTSHQAGPPFLPCPPGAVGRVPKARVRGLGTGAGAASSWVFSSPLRARQCPVSRVCSGAVVWAPASPHPPAAISIDICCAATPGKHHMLTLVGSSSLPPSLEETENKRDMAPTLNQPSSQGGLSQAPPVPRTQAPNR